MRDSMVFTSQQKTSHVHKKLGNKVVVYNNDLNRLNIGTFAPSLQDVFVTIIACARGGKEISGEIIGIESMLTHKVEISFDDFRKMTGITVRGDKYLIETMEKFGKDIASLQYKLILPSKIIGGSLFPLYEINETERMLKVAVSPSLSYILNDTDRNFTEFMVEDHNKLAGKTTKTLYRILCQWKTQGYTCWFPIEEIKTVFGMNGYVTRDFLAELKKAIKELTNKKSFRNLKIEFKKDLHKKGTPVTDVRFTFTKTMYTPVLIPKEKK